MNENQTHFSETKKRRVRKKEKKTQQKKTSNLNEKEKQKRKCFLVDFEKKQHFVTSTLRMKSFDPRKGNCQFHFIWIFFYRPFALKLVDLCTFKAREKKRLGKGFVLFSHRDDVVFCPQIDRNYFKRRLLKWWFSGRKSIILWRLEAIISIKLFAIVVQIAWINSTELKSELYSFLLVLHSIESFWYEILPLIRPNSLVHWTQRTITSSRVSHFFSMYSKYLHISCSCL